MLDFVVNNYIIILVVGVFLIFALIGFAVDTTKNRKNKESELLNQPNDDVNINNLEASGSEESIEEEESTPAPVEEVSEEDLNSITNEGPDIPEAE